MFISGVFFSFPKYKWSSQEALFIYIINKLIIMKTLLLVTLLAFCAYSQVLEVRDSLEIRTWDQNNSSKSLLLHHLDLKSFP